MSFFCGTITLMNLLPETAKRDRTMTSKKIKHILVVDDENLIRYTLSAAFQDAETEVIAAPDGKSALKALRDWYFDFCFLDLHLPDMSGLDIMRMIRLTAPTTKVIIMTGSVVDDTTGKAIRENAYLLLGKPFDLFQVKRVLKSRGAGDPNVFHELAELEERPPVDRRRFQRQPVTKEVTFAMGSQGGTREMDFHHGNMIDISDTGTRIGTRVELEPGSLVRFKNVVNNVSGVVRWTASDEQNRRWLAGIQFVGLERG
jgi:CheY-like chemotaxis protein